MTTNYHTAIATGESNAPATLNTRFSGLDAQLSTQAAQITALNTSGAGSVYAQINNASGEGDTSWSVDNINGTFLAGATVVYAVSGVVYASTVAANTSTSPLTVTAAPGVTIPDNTVISQVPAAAAGKFLDGYINAKDPTFGATGDGTTDDSAAIQAAIDAARSNGGGVVELPPGDYYIASPIEVEGDALVTNRAGASFVTLRGLGENTRIVADGSLSSMIRAKRETGVSITNIVGNNEGSPPKTVTVTAASHGLSVNNLVTISGTTNFNGKALVATVPDANTFTFNDSTRGAVTSAETSGTSTKINFVHGVTIENLGLYSSDSSAYGIDVDGWVRYWIRDCKFIDLETGIFSELSNTTWIARIERNQFEGCDDYAIKLAGIYDYTVAENVIENCAGGIRVGNGSGTQDPCANTFRIQNNVIESIVTNPAIYLEAVMATRISGNYFEGNSGGDIQVGSATLSKGLVLEANSFQVYSSNKTAAYFPIKLSKPMGTVVSGNFSDYQLVGQFGSNIDSSAGIVYIGNRITTGDTAPYTYTSNDSIFLESTGIGINTKATNASLEVSPISNSKPQLYLKSGSAPTAPIATFDQNGSDGDVMHFKSTDVAHGMTTIAPTDVWGFVDQFAGDSGGLKLSGLSEGALSIGLYAYPTTVSTNRTSAASAAIILNAAKASGTGATAMGTDGNILAVRDNGTTRALIDAEGDLHLDATSNINVWDDHEDHIVARAIRAALAPSDSELRTQYADIVDQYSAGLAAAGIVTLNEDGHHFINMKRLALFQLDALYQLGKRLNTEFAARLEALERKLLG